MFVLLNTSKKEDTMAKLGQIAREFTHSFPAMKGVQAGREYYVAMFPLKLLPTFFKQENDDLPPALRAQRALNKARVRPLSNYITKNSKNYIFSSLTASVNGKVEFEKFNEDAIGQRLGTLHVPMDAKFLINDGQHRRAAIEDALEKVPEIANETISIVLFVDEGLKKSQQMFADLNRYAIRPTKSLGILYDHRDPMSRLTNRLTKKVIIFKGMTETARSTISNRSRKLFTLSSIYQATKRLLHKKDGEGVSKEEESFAEEFWNETAKNMPDWLDAVARKVNTSELRQDYIHSHGVALQALAITGSSLIATYPQKWQQKLGKLQKINWRRDNADLWEGRALTGGRLSRAENNVLLTSNVIKATIGLSLDPKETQVEELYAKGKNHK